MKKENIQYDLVVQPIDALLNKLKLSNHDLVAASSEQLSHKVVHKARIGRRLTSRMKTKVLNALCSAYPKKTFAHRELFNY